MEWGAPKVSNDATHLEGNPPYDNPMLLHEKDKGAGIWK